MVGGRILLPYQFLYHCVGNLDESERWLNNLWKVGRLVSSQGVELSQNMDGEDFLVRLDGNRFWGEQSADSVVHMAAKKRHCES